MLGLSFCQGAILICSLNVTAAYVVVAQASSRCVHVVWVVQAGTATLYILVLFFFLQQQSPVRAVGVAACLRAGCAVLFALLPRPALVVVFLRVTILSCSVSRL